jgi:hypothetical protein
VDPIDDVGILGDGDDDNGRWAELGGATLLDSHDGSCGRIPANVQDSGSPPFCFVAGARKVERRGCAPGIRPPF